MSYPSTITAFVTPLPTNRLNNPSHSSIETAQNTALSEIMRAVGTDASTIGTIIGDLRNTNSNGGGHVQTAVKGGTGQVSYNKGDLLIPTNSSTLTKLAVGPDTQFLQANSSTATGITWASSPSPKQTVNITPFKASATGEYSIFSTTLLGSVLAQGNAVRTTTHVNTLNFDNGGNTITFKYTLGGSPVASIILTSPGTSGGNFNGTLRHTMYASTIALQTHVLEMDFMNFVNTTNNVYNLSINPNSTTNPSVPAIWKTSSNFFSSINGSGSQAYGATVLATPGNGINMSIMGTIVEKFI